MARSRTNDLNNSIDLMYQLFNLQLSIPPTIATILHSVCRRRKLIKKQSQRIFLIKFSLCREFPEFFTTPRYF
jgi:hypothetical protein